eukprot:1444604-Rhodomonas_salina.2
MSGTNVEVRWYQKLNAMRSSTLVSGLSRLASGELRWAAKSNPRPRLSRTKCTGMVVNCSESHGTRWPVPRARMVLLAFMLVAPYGSAMQCEGVWCYACALPCLVLRARMVLPADTATNPVEVDWEGLA